MDSCTKEIAIKAVLHGACRIPELKPLSEFTTSDLIWAEDRGVFPSLKKDASSRILILKLADLSCNLNKSRLFR